TTADFDGDGRLDVAVTNSWSGNAVSVFLNTGPGTFSAAQTLPAGAYATGAVAADFNNDGRPDLAVSNQNGNSVCVLINNGGQGVSGAVQFKVDGSPIGAPVGLARGVASLTMSSLVRGAHSITAVYGGNANFNASTSSE